MALQPTSSMSREDSGLSNFLKSFSLVCTRWMPESLVFVFALTFFVFALAWAVTPHGPIQLIDDYLKGFWILLTFAMQMCILMVTGFAVADSKPASRLIAALVDLPKTRVATVVMYSMIGAFLWWLHWGIGMMACIIMGRENRCPETRHGD